MLLGEGVYTGDGNRDLSFSGKGIVLTRVSPWVTTIIDCEADSVNAHRAFTFEDDEDSTSVTSNIVIRNAYAPLDTIAGSLGVFIGRFGGAIDCDSNTSPRIEDCRFERCGADIGGGLFAWFAPNLRVEGCTFASNQAGSGSAAVVGYSRADFLDCVIDSNAALSDGPAGIEYVVSTGTQTNCVYRFNSIQRGQGGAVVITDTSAVVFNSCSFVGNEVTETGVMAEVSMLDGCRSASSPIVISRKMLQ